MLKRVTLKNFGPLTSLDWMNLESVNLIIGGNGAGKTFLLKALYTAMRTVEEYRRGDDQRAEGEILAEKLYWTFQPEKIGDLASKGTDGPLSCSVTLDGKVFGYRFGRDTSKQITSLDNSVPRRDNNSVFLPAKEVLSLYSILFSSRERDRVFGFDDTYLDLARALRNPPTKGKNYLEFAKARETLAEIIGGNVEYDESSGRWYFKKKKGNTKFPIGLTAEGFRKIGILDTLLGNRYLTPGSVIFIDEPESALHPTAISRFLDIVAMLAGRGLQFFLASHSYFVVKKLALIAQKKKMNIPVMSIHDGTHSMADLLDGMPDNPIIDESINLYREEVELALA